MILQVKDNKKVVRSMHWAQQNRNGGMPNEVYSNS